MLSESLSFGASVVRVVFHGISNGGAQGGDPTMAKRPRIRDLEPIRQNVLRHLKDAELLLDLRRWAASLAASYSALEEAGKYAAKAGGSLLEMSIPEQRRMTARLIS